MLLQVIYDLRENELQIVIGARDPPMLYACSAGGPHRFLPFSTTTNSGAPLIPRTLRDGWEPQIPRPHRTQTRYKLKPMQVTIDIPDETAALLQARGVELTAFLEQAAIREAHTSSRPASEAISQAIDRILERRNHLDLNGLTIRDLINEGRKY